MGKWRVTQIDSTVYIYEFEAKDKKAAEHKWLKGEGYLPEYDKIIDIQLEFEKLN